MRKVIKGKLGDLNFQLNPTTMTHDGGAIWAEINSPNMAKPISSYSYGKSETYSFELWFCERHEVPVNVNKVYKTLNKYRNSKSPIIFALGTLVVKVVVTECPFNIGGWDSDLIVKDLKVPITLRVV